MFRAKEMKRVRIIVLKSKVDAVIMDLHEAGVVDIRKSSYEGLEDGRPLASFEELSTELMKLRSALGLMEATAGKKPEKEPELIPGARALSESRGLAAEVKLKELNRECNALAERLKTLENDGATATKLSAFKNVDFSRLSTRTLAFKAGELPPAKAAALSEKLEKLGGQLVQEAEAQVALILYENNKAEKVETALSDAGFTELPLPYGMTTPSETLKRISAEAGIAKGQLEASRSKMAELSRANIAKVRSLIRSLEAEAERAEIAARFASSRSIYVIEGWSKADDGPKLGAIVQKHGDAAMMEDVKYGHKEMPPTVLDNPKIVEPLEFITKSYSMPNYYEFDPTIAYFIVLPIVYGMMVGDVFYGLFSILFSLWLLGKFKKGDLLHSVARIWLYCGIPSVLFGFVFDEYGGMSHFHLMEYIKDWTGIALLNAPLYTGFHRMEDALTLIGITTIIGSIHLAAGFIIGAYNEWGHERKHAYAKLSWLGAEIGLIVTLLPYLNVVFPQLAGIPAVLAIPGGIIFLVSAAGLAVFEGIVGIAELPSLLSNILSYARIAALGIVGVAIAEIVNDYVMPLPEAGILAIVLVPIFLGLHAANCLLAMFEALIQGGRLNLVEFKSKFLHGGGDMFVPFALHSNKD
ncbi:MAG: V-type ATPase 116kDa subunit family protein [Candidatus ainarchaeum sp.]|nr:V-type ATPase 116kDa subunit family protein [Candidatus ainarchaeum sp.]